MAVDPGVDAQVRASIGAEEVIIIDIVVDELRYRGSVAATARWAATALTWLQALPAGWHTIEASVYLTDEEIVDVQDDVADGRALQDSYEHWAESAVIAMARRTRAGSNPRPLRHQSGRRTGVADSPATPV